MSVNGNFLLVVHPPSSPSQTNRPVPELATLTQDWPGPENLRQVHRHQATLPGGLQFDLQWQGDGWHYIGNAQVGAMGMSNGPHGDDFDGVLHAWLQSRQMPVERCLGRFVLVCWDIPNGQIHVVTDAFKTWPVCYASQGSDGFVAANDMRLLVASHRFTPELSNEALYHYLNFYYVPAYSAIYSAARKLSGGQRLSWKKGRMERDSWWQLQYPEDLDPGRARAATALREKIIETVRSYRPSDEQHWGAFLSGGTDSSSICGILAAGAAPRKVSSFSIGFVEEGYDELGFAEIAAQAFDLDAHKRRVSESEATDVLPLLIRTFDEPFGNASAIPTYYCARMAADAGKDLLVAGDGGDEIFGGNERYLKDRIFGIYHALPSPLRGLGSLLARGLQVTDQRWANRIRNFIERGSLPNPDRFYTDDSFASDHYDELLTPAFRQHVKRDASLDLQREVWSTLTARSELHRLMHLDLTMAIADNDIVKVTGACRSAGVSVRFPYLDRSLVEYTARLPARYKLKGTQKRALFKEAMMSTLPEAIRRKKKQGFGLPVSLWMRGQGPFRQLLNDTLESPNARLRDIVEMETVRKLLERHQRGAWDHASELYQLLVLELWLQRHARDIQH